MENKHTYTVGELNRLIQSTLANVPALMNIAVTGEISEYTIHRSGHHYFTLKDETGRISCVMFRREAERLIFRPEKGMKIVAQGRVTVYPPNGAYQLQCVSLAPDGVGALQIAYDQMVAKLKAEGLFDEAHKKPLPRFPGAIAVITSANGQAIKDIKKVLCQRFPMVEVRLLPAIVEGADAPDSLVRAMEYANREQVADLIIIGRGGGAAATLECFNNERVARAIYASRIPVISAVGHEGNMSVADLVADKRASTPSNAAELAVPDQEDLRRQLLDLKQRMREHEKHNRESWRQKLKELAEKQVLTDPLSTVRIHKQELDHRYNRLYNAARNMLAQPKEEFRTRKRDLKDAVRHRLEQPRQNLEFLASRLDAMSPLKVLGRGYALVTGTGGKPLQRVVDVPVGSRITANLSDGELRCRVEETIMKMERKS